MKNYQDEKELDDKEFHFIRKILSVNPKIQSALFESDPSLLLHAVESILDTLNDLKDALESEERDCNLH